ncbi:MAG: OmpA family protein, partial [Rickettsiales bacterium]|nr:OmpA family protein [Rickettsiales bacterium]
APKALDPGAAAANNAAVKAVDPDAPAGTTPADAAESAAVKATANAIAAPAKISADKTPPTMRIVFKTTETTIPLTVNDELNKLAKQLIQNDNSRVTLIAYASAAGDQASTARRISLSRALSVRAFLIDAGVNNLRINVQAEGDKNPGGDADRVDLYVQNAPAAQ